MAEGCQSATSEVTVIPQEALGRAHGRQASASAVTTSQVHLSSVPTYPQRVLSTLLPRVLIPPADLYSKRFTNLGSCKQRLPGGCPPPLSGVTPRPEPSVFSLEQRRRFSGPAAHQCTPSPGSSLTDRQSAPALRSCQETLYTSDTAAAQLTCQHQLRAGARLRTLPPRLWGQGTLPCLW